MPPVRCLSCRATSGHPLRRDKVVVSETSFAFRPNDSGARRLADGDFGVDHGEQAPRPLTFANVRSFFSDTLRIRPTEVQKRCAIFYEGEWQNANTYNYCVIIVENSDEDLQVTFYLTDDRVE